MPLPRLAPATSARAPFRLLDENDGRLRRCRPLLWSGRDYDVGTELGGVACDAGDGDHAHALTDRNACHLEHEVLATRRVGRDGFDGQHRESFPVTRWVGGHAIELDPESGAGEATQRAAYDCRSGGESGRAR